MVVRYLSEVKFCIDVELFTWISALLKSTKLKTAMYFKGELDSSNLHKNLGLLFTIKPTFDVNLKFTVSLMQFTLPNNKGPIRKVSFRML